MDSIFQTWDDNDLHEFREFLESQLSLNNFDFAPNSLNSLFGIWEIFRQKWTTIETYGTISNVFEKPEKSLRDPARGSANPKDGASRWLIFFNQMIDFL